jgi:GrpB-like predicted nucleotidyltransferase (UPF0157 family)
MAGELRVAALETMPLAPLDLRQHDDAEVEALPTTRQPKPFGPFSLGHTQLGSDDWLQPLMFRDRLRVDPALRERYDDLKRDLAQQFPDDRDRYTRSKVDAIRNVLRA